MPHTLTHTHKKQKKNIPDVGFAIDNKKRVVLTKYLVVHGNS